jgi:acyl-coenzyme A synthetase/AMP-(fatty) acid ligase
MPGILYDLISVHARKSPDRTAIFFENRAISYGEFFEDINRASSMLLGFGIGHGDRVGFMFPNRPEILMLYFACFRIGAVAVPVNTRYQKQEIGYALDHSECRLLVIDKTYREITADMVSRVPSLERIIIRDENLGQHPQALHHHMAQAADNHEWPLVHPNDPAIIFYTSGSTDRPKGVTHTHFSLLANARIQVATREIDQDTVTMASTGVGYIAGLSGLSLPTFLAGASLVLVEERTPERLLEHIEKYSVKTTLMLPTTLLDVLECPSCRDTDMSSLRNCFVGGDECSPDLYRRYRERMGRDLYQLFGMTECEGYLSNRPSGPNRVGTVGVPSEGVKVRLVDESGGDVPLGHKGELIVHADSVMIGYWEDLENTEKTLRDGWLYGGDIASRDERGFYTFRERKREVIIHGGSNVGPHEVENIIDSYPDVMESCVVGVPDEHFGAILEAYVEWEPDAEKPELDQLKKYVAANLASYKVPDRWKVMDPLPKTATGKLDRKRLHMAASEESKKD